MADIWQIFGRHIFRNFCGQFACILQALYRVFESSLQIICRQFARSSDISQVDSNENFAMDSYFFSFLWWFKSAFCTENSSAVLLNQSFASKLEKQLEILKRIRTRGTMLGATV